MRASGRTVQVKELMIEVGKEHIYNHKFCQKRKLPSPESEASSRPTGKQLTQQKQEDNTEDKDGGTGSTASASEISVMVGKVDKDGPPVKKRLVTAGSVPSGPPPGLESLTR